MQARVITKMWTIVYVAFVLCISRAACRGSPKTQILNLALERARLMSIVHAHTILLSSRVISFMDSLLHVTSQL